MNTTGYKKLKSVLMNRLLGMSQIDPRYVVVINAFRFAESVHTGVRKDGVTPEFYHQLSILGRAMNLHALLVDPLSVYVAILLHDSPEDYPKTIDRISVEFPDHLQNSLDLSKYDFKETSLGHVESDAKTMTAYMDKLSRSPVLSVAKLMDRLHNLSTMLKVFSPEKIRSYIDDVYDYFLPMLKAAKRNFPEQDAVYELLKSDLNLICSTVSHFLPKEKKD